MPENETVDLTFEGFAPAEASDMPDLACLGVITEVADAKEAKSKNYLHNKIRISPRAAGRGVDVYFLWRPDWFDRGFNPATLEDAATENDPRAGEKMLMVYRKNIAARGSTPLLEGLCGDKKTYVDIAKAIFALPKDEDGYPSADGVTKVLRDFFLERNEGRILGYRLTQQKTKVGVNEEGKAQYAKENRYELQGFFATDRQGLKRIKAAAEKPGSKLRLTFDPDDIDVF